MRGPRAAAGGAGPHRATTFAAAVLATGESYGIQPAINHNDKSASIRWNQRLGGHSWTFLRTGHLVVKVVPELNIALAHDRFPAKLACIGHSNACAQGVSVSTAASARAGGASARESAGYVQPPAMARRHRVRPLPKMWAKCRWVPSQ